MGKRLSRREFVAGLATASGAALLAACAAPATPEVVEVEKEVVVKETVIVEGTPQVVEKVVTATPAPEAPPEEAAIRFSAWSWGAESDQVWTTLIDEFRQNFPYITVEEERMGFGDYWQKIQTEAAGGVAPDVQMMSVAYICQFARDKLVLNLMPLINRDNLDLSAYWQAGLDEWRYREGDRGAGNGDLFALTVDFSSTAFLYNKTLFDAAGIPYPEEGWTWDTIVEVGTQLTIDSNGDGTPEQWGYVVIPWADMGLDMYVRQNGGMMLNTEYTECLLDRPRALEAGEWMYDRYHTDQLSPIPESDMLDPWTTGTAAMCQQPTWNLGGYAKIQEFEWDVAPTPAGPSGSSSVIGQGDAMSIFAQTPYPDASWELLKHLTGPGERGPEMIVETGMQPPTRDLTYSDTYLKQPGFPEHMRIIAEELETATPCFVCLNFMELADELGGNTMAAWLGEATVEEAFLTAKQAADEILERIEL